MCGIFGMIRFGHGPYDQKWVRAASDALKHRGPDDGDIYVSPDRTVVLGHRRLSIIDLTVNGRQPMWNEDGTIAIVFNGQIYNFKDMRKELTMQGHRFRSETDTEVAIHGYEQYGEDILHRMQGMFAFGLWDANKRLLLMARDPMGKKPLYVSRMPQLFLFASEIKALLRHPNVTRDLNPVAIRDYFTLGYVPAPRTIFRAIQKVPAGFMIRVRQNGDVTSLEYWDDGIRGNEDIDSQDYAYEVRQRVEKAVAKRLVADVPIGAFLSGGLDSTIVTSLMQHMAYRPVKTFSIGFDAGTSTQKVNFDAEQAWKTAKLLGTEHHEITIRPSTDLPSLIDRAICHLDEPIANPTIIPSIILADFARDHGVKVILTGDGGDELFMGYARYFYDRILSQLKQIHPFVRKGVSSLIGYTMIGATWKAKVRRALYKTDALACEFPDRYWNWRQLFSQHEQNTLLAEDLRNLTPSYPQEINEHIVSLVRRYPLKSVQETLAYLDLKIWIPDENNMRLDKMLMAASVEGRAPFLDEELVKYALSIPYRFKKRGLRSKYILRQAFSDLLKNTHLAFRKKGFFSPVRYWIGAPLKSYLNDVFCNDSVRDLGILDSRAIAYAMNGGFLHRAPLKIWAIMVLQRWGQIYLR